VRPVSLPGGPPAAPLSTSRFFTILPLALRMLGVLREGPNAKGFTATEEGWAMTATWRRMLVGTAVAIAFLVFGILEIALG
jgi:hypothetical protein